jgi:molybdate transport system ATP-binding protein
VFEVKIRHDFDDFKIDVDFISPPGSRVTALFGPSGSGKTTLVQIVAGLIRAQTGRVVVGERVLFDSKTGVDLPAHARRIGYIFQESRLFPHLSVTRNLTYGMRGLAPEDQYVDFDQVVTILGIEHLLERSPANLSGGEKQRVAIGRALLTSPSLLLLDEPLASLDKARKDEVLPFLAALPKHFDIPMLYVSHSMEEILQLVDSLVLLEQGQVKACGPIEQVLSKAGRGSGGSLMRATVKEHEPAHGLTRLSVGDQSLWVRQVNLEPGASLRVQIRPQDIVLSKVPPSQMSVQNVLKGIIVAVERLPDTHRVEVTIDCGVVFMAEVTSRAAEHLQLAAGTEIYALTKTVSIAMDRIVPAPIN